MSKKILLLFFIVFLLAVNVLGLQEELNVTTCSGATSCSEANYNDNTTSIGHTIAKAGTGTSEWSNFQGDVSSTLGDVWFYFRHGGEADVANNWGIDFKDVAGTTTYCSINDIAMSSSDTYDTRNTTTDCSWTISRLDDLKIEVTSGVSGKPANGYIYYADLYITYTGLPFGILNATITDPTTDITIDSNTSFYLNATVTCNGDVGAVCGIVYAWARYNTSGVEPDTTMLSHYFNVFNDSFDRADSADLGNGWVETDNVDCLNSIVDGTYKIYDPSGVGTGERACAAYHEDSFEGTALNNISFDWQIESATGDGAANYILIYNTTGGTYAQFISDTDGNYYWNHKDGSLNLGAYTVTEWDSFIMQNITTTDYELIYDGVSQGTLNFTSPLTGAIRFRHSSAGGREGVSYLDNLSITSVNMSFVSPLYTIYNENPLSKILNQGDEWNISWLVNYTGTQAYYVDVLFNSSYGSASIPDNDTNNRKINPTGGAPPADISFTLTYPNSGCSEGNGCTTASCTACTYCHINFSTLYDSNVSCVGQNSTVPFWIYTNTGDVSMDIVWEWNETIDSALTLKYDTDNNPTGATIVPDPPTTVNIALALAQGNNQSIWGWGDLTVGVAGNYTYKIDATSSQS
ncbi:hypothetical protein GOV04_05015 [Candidatus Woesearchaeota archaeon]|nr:hypothetical protein [Candidatus Woesearchaeota archaeon]